MSNDFKFPDVGEGIHEGEIVKWHVHEGDFVKKDQVVADIETDKAVVQIPSPFEGKVLKIYHKEGDTVKVGEVLITVGEKGETVAEKPAISVKEAAQPERKSTSVIGEIKEGNDVLPSESEGHEVVPAERIHAVTRSVAHILATPAVRRLARDLKVDLAEVPGTGKDGRITEEDVRKHGKTSGAVSEPKAEVRATSGVTVTKKYDMWGYIDHVPLKGVRKAIAKHMVESVSKAPHVTHMNEVDVTELWNIREKEKKKAEKKGAKLTFLPFIIKAYIAAAKEFPTINAAFDDDHEEIVVKKYYNIGVAVDTEDGLMVPVVKIADQKSILDLAQEVEKLAVAARERKIDLMDLKGTSFTITNVGSIGGIFATPIINYPDVAIMALGKIYDKVVVNPKGKFESRKFMPFSISFDHRVIDGAYVARFANALKERLEDPEEMLVELK